MLRNCDIMNRYITFLNYEALINFCYNKLLTSYSTADSDIIVNVLYAL